MNTDIEKYINSRIEEFEKEMNKKREEFKQNINEEVAQMTKPKTIWDLDIEDGEEYYHLYGDSVVAKLSFGNHYDERAREVGNAFLTKEEAEFEAERRRIEAIMKKYSRPFKYEEENWYIGYSHKVGKIVIEAHYTLVDRNPHFETKEMAQKVIDEIGKSRLKKYWFKIKDDE